MPSRDVVLVAVSCCVTLDFALAILLIAQIFVVHERNFFSVNANEVTIYNEN